MRLEDLNYFLEVAQAGHVGRASEKLGQSQPALTKGVQRLEHELGIQLFERNAKGMTLTSAGSVFFERVLQVRSSLDDAIKEANDLHLGKIGLVRVGVPASILSMFFSEACTELIKQRPAAHIQISIGLNDSLYSSLRLGDLDLCIAALARKGDPEFEQIPLFDDELVVIARDRHPLLDRRSLRLADLCDYSWLLPNTSVVARRLVEARFAEAGLPAPNVAVETNSSAAALLSVIHSSDLLTVLGRRTVAQTQGLAILEIASARWQRSIGVLRRKDAYQSPLAERLIQILLERSQVYRAT